MVALLFPFENENFCHALSGAIASIVAVGLFFPLETVKTRAQIFPIQHQNAHLFSSFFKSFHLIYKSEGFVGLYKGCFAVMITLWCSNFIYFYTYVFLQKSFSSYHEKGRSSIIDMSAAFVAGCVNVLVTAPLWTANTRLKLQGLKSKENKDVICEQWYYKGLFDALYVIERDEGISALFSGVSPSIILTFNPAIQWSCYEFFKAQCQWAANDSNLSAATYFAISAIAKLISTVATYPLQVLQTRMRLNKASCMESLHYLVKEGPWALFYGLQSKIAQTVLTGAFMVTVYEKMVKIIVSYIKIT